MKQIDICILYNGQLLAISALLTTNTNQWKLKMTSVFSDQSEHFYGRLHSFPKQSSVCLPAVKEYITFYPATFLVPSMPSRGIGVKNMGSLMGVCC